MIANTSREAYSNLKPHLGVRQQQVLRAIRILKRANNQEIAKWLGWEINRVTGRVHELAELKVIRQDGYKLTPSNKKAKAWVEKEGK